MKVQLKELHQKARLARDPIGTEAYGAAVRYSALPVVVLVTDGAQTIDGGQRAAARAAHRLRDEGATLFTWGFGDVDQSALRELATEPTDFHHFFGADISQLRRRVLELLHRTAVSPVR